MDARFQSHVGEDRVVNTSEELQAVLSKITFGPSCINMGWQWEVQPMHTPTIPAHAMGWLINTTFRRPERETGAVGIGRGRQWWIDRGATESSIVKTCFSAAKMIIEHELMEAFHYDGARIFDPHNTVAELASIQRRG